uniref:Peptidase S1 domain-containing protein n=1 Tax=Panagrolaimus sp. ES5 TaxID=591445 RepID=A0AC34G8N4_9BILA
RIGYGEITPADLFQFAVLLHSPGSICTGSIISKRHVLTAAHFIYDKESLKTEHDTYRVYGKTPYHVEVRAVGLIDQSKMPMTTTVYLPKTYTWPPRKWNDIAILEFPEGTDFGVEPVKSQKQFRTLKICGGNETHKALSGDSGGPMLIYRNDKWYQIGVSAETGDYDTRTRISAYCNFIEEVTKNDVQCESIFPENKNNNKMLTIKYFEPIYKGQETPSKMFDFVIPLYSYHYQHGCTATVISKRHLLTSGYCVYVNDETERVTNYSNFRSVYAKFFPDFRSKNVHLSFVEPVNVTAYFSLNYKWPWDHNLAIIEFPDGTDFGIEPLTLGKDYFQVYLDNETFIVAGYGKYEFKNSMHTIAGASPILRHTNARFQSDRYTDIK